ncbi:MAG: PhoU domain-containing protein [Polyangiaceae bacterium]
MLRELMNVFRGEPLKERATESFATMLTLSREMILEACEVYWGRELSPEERTRLYDKDVQLNKLQRSVRKHVVAELSGPVPSNVPWGLLLMSLVKDVERIGDYAKNLTELSTWCPAAFPEDEATGELREITRAVTLLAREAPDVFQRSDGERARELLVEGRSLARRCDDLVRKIAASDYGAETAVKMAVGARFLKRVQGHFLNLLTAVVMPLHKLDYYDEAALSR